MKIDITSLIKRDRSREFWIEKFSNTVTFVEFQTSFYNTLFDQINLNNKNADDEKEYRNKLKISFMIEDIEFITVLDLNRLTSYISRQSNIVIDKISSFPTPHPKESFNIIHGFYNFLASSNISGTFGWKVLYGKENSGKTTILKYFLTKKVNDSDPCAVHLGSNAEFGYLWIDLLGVLNIDQLYSRIASCCSLRGATNLDILVSFRKMLRKIPNGSIIVLDHFNLNHSCNLILSLLNSFQAHICVFIICRENSPSLSELLNTLSITPDYFSLPSLSHSDKLELFATLSAKFNFNNNKIQKQLIEHLIDDNINETPGAISRCFALASLTPNSTVNFNCIFDENKYFNYIHTNLQKEILQFLNCVAPLLQLSNSVPFPKSLLWYLCEHQISKISFDDAYNALTKIGWLRIFDENSEVMYIQFCNNNIIGDIEFSDSSWNRYYSYWVDKLTSQLELLSMTISDGKVVKYPPFVFYHLAKSSVVGDATRVVINNFDEYRQHYDCLFASILDNTSTNTYQSHASDPVHIATSLAGNLGLYCYARMDTSNAISLMKKVLQYCQSTTQTVVSKRATVLATLDLGLQLQAAQQTTAAISLYQNLIASLRPLRVEQDAKEKEVEKELIDNNNNNYNNYNNQDDKIILKEQDTLLISALYGYGACISLSQLKLKRNNNVSIMVAIEALEVAIQLWKARPTLIATQVTITEEIEQKDDQEEGNDEDSEPKRDIVMMMLLYEYSGVQLTVGNFASANRSITEAINISHAIFHQDNLLLVQLNRQLIRIKCSEKNYDEAVLLLENTLKIVRKHYGNGYMQEAEIFREFGNIFASFLSRHYAGLRRLDRALLIFEDILSPAHSLVGEVCADIAKVYLKLGRLDEAECGYQRALDTLQNNFGDSDLQLAPVYIGMANVLIQKMKYQEAISLLERSLVIYQCCNGEDDVSVAETSFMLAQLFLENNKLIDAEALYEKAVAIFREQRGRCQDEVAASLFGLSNAYLELMKFEEAESACEEAIVIYRQLYGDSHIKVAEAYSMLGSILLEADKVIDAEDLFERAVHTYKKIYPNGHISCADALNHWAGALQSIANLTKAKEVYLEAEAMIGQYYKEKVHEDVAKIHNNLATLYEDMGQKEVALKSYEKSLEILRKIYGEDAMNPKIAIILQNIAAMFEDEGGLVEAKKMYQEAIIIYRECFGEEYIAVQNILASLHNIDKKMESSFQCRIT